MEYSSNQDGATCEFNFLGKFSFSDNEAVRNLIEEFKDSGCSQCSVQLGRLDDIGQNGMHLIDDIRTIYDNYPDLGGTQILVASIRSPAHVVEAAKLGADVCTIPPSVIKQLVQHPLTDKGLEGFLKDWAKTGQSI